MRRLTIRDVARRLNLSITTVSRALDGYDDVADNTRREVLRVANEMGYAPNRAARQLRRRQSDTIGYILPASMPQFNEPFYAEFVAGLGDQSSLRGYDLLTSSAPANSQEERDLYQYWLHSGRVDGMILNRMRLHDWRVNYMAQTDIPFAALETPANIPAGARAGFVEVDSASVFALLTQYLVSHGHRRIAFIGGDEEYKIHHQRQEGYRQGLLLAGIDFDVNLVRSGDFGRAGGYQQAQALLALAQPPSALVCINDLTALGAAQAVRESGLVIGKQIAISGFDGSDEMLHSIPPLTTMRQPLANIAGCLVDMLIDWLAGVAVDQPLCILPEMILRPSTAFYLER